ncbi:hypothetical protein ACLOJK_010169 [Asimina triloba]
MAVEERVASSQGAALFLPLISAVTRPQVQLVGRHESVHQHQTFVKRQTSGPTGYNLTRVIHHSSLATPSSASSNQQQAWLFCKSPVLPLFHLGMGSLENGLFMKRTPLLRSSLSSGRGDRHSPFFQRPRSRFARFLLFEKVDYLQWICTVAVFFFVVVLFEAFLPGSVTEKSSIREASVVTADLAFLKEFDGLDFGEGIRFEPSKLLEKFRKETNASSRWGGRPGVRSAVRKPQLALVVADLAVDAVQLMMTSVAVPLQEIGYSIQVYSLKEGPGDSVWRNLGLPVTILPISNKSEMTVDWLKIDKGKLYPHRWETTYDANDELYPQHNRQGKEPFKSLPVIWMIHERALADRLRRYTLDRQTQLINEWRRAFNRATVVVFPNYVLPMMYAMFDAGNYYVIPGSPDEAWEAHYTMDLHPRHNSRTELGYRSEDLVVAIVGSQFSYRGLWLEHALVLQALVPLLADASLYDQFDSYLKVGFLGGNSSRAYKVALEAIALKIGYPRGSVQHIGDDGDVDDRVNGFVYPKENMSVLTQILFQVVSKGKLTPLAQQIASIGQAHAKNLMVSETVEGHALLLESVLKLPSEVAFPKSAVEIPPKLKEEWQWKLFKELGGSGYLNRTFRTNGFLNHVEESFIHAHEGRFPNLSGTVDDVFSSSDWEVEKIIEKENARKRREEEELKGRTDQPHGTWDDVYRNAKRADRTKNELHERDDRELERTGQPLCIYEPFHGEGTWPFLHRTSLYRGIGLSNKGRRPGLDDIDATSRLPLLSDSYYRDVLGEYGAFFALANRIDRIHKNAWIGFQSWRAAARKDSLSKAAEIAVLQSIQQRKHGDTLYFWVRMDKDPRNPLNQDFWSFCDAINAGNCRFAVSEALRKMYGMRHNWDSLPPMPTDGDTWSVMHSWALPTRSFLEFVMFSRMFVDAMDAQMHDEHHQSGRCYLSLSKDRHCYSRVLELLINVWAYHSARRMVYVNPETGMMQEQHKLKSRRGHMWIRWFSFAMLKSMDEDLAEEYDSDHPDRRWLWPSTGEVFWQGIYERERHQRHRQKERRKQQSKEKMSRMRKRSGRQKTLGKYVKPPPEAGNSTSTSISSAEKHEFSRKLLMAGIMFTLLAPQRSKHDERRHLRKAFEFSDVASRAIGYQEEKKERNPAAVMNGAEAKREADKERCCLLVVYERQGRAYILRNRSTSNSVSYSSDHLQSRWNRIGIVNNVSELGTDARQLMVLQTVQITASRWIILITVRWAIKWVSKNHDEG